MYNYYENLVREGKTYRCRDVEERRKRGIGMADNASGGSPTPVATTETPAQNNAQVPEAPGVTDEQWRAMRQVLDAIYNHREPE